MQSVICGIRALAVAIFSRSLSSVSVYMNGRQTYVSGITTEKTAVACSGFPLVFRWSLAASSLFSIVIVSPTLSPQVVSDQQKVSGSRPFILSLRIKPLTIPGTCHPCVGKQNPIRSPGCRENS